VISKFFASSIVILVFVVLPNGLLPNGFTYSCPYVKFIRKEKNAVKRILVIGSVTW
jgi:hypothetical protein